MVELALAFNDNVAPNKSFRRSFEGRDGMASEICIPSRWLKWARARSQKLVNVTHNIDLRPWQTYA
jgi:hypothetical protein